MKKTRLILSLESLENRVVPSGNPHVLVGMETVSATLPAVSDETETVRIQTDVHPTEALGSARPEAPERPADSASADPGKSLETRGGDNVEKNADSDRSGQSNHSTKSTSGDAEENAALRTDALDVTTTKSKETGNSDTSKVDSETKGTSDSEVSKAENSATEAGNSETRNSDTTKVDSETKGTSDSEVSKAEDSAADASNSETRNSDTTKVDSETKGTSDSEVSKAENSAADAGNSNSTSVTRASADSARGSGDSQTGTALTSSNPTAHTSEGSGSGSKEVGDTKPSLVTDKASPGKSTSGNKETPGTDTTTDTVNSTGGSKGNTTSEGLVDPLVASSLGLANRAGTHLTGSSAEVNSSTGDSGLPAPGFILNGEGIAGFSSVAAVLTAREAGLSLPVLASAALPVALPMLESLTPQSGLGDWSALAVAESLAPVASDLIVGFLPAEQVALGSAMQGVLSEINDLGEQWATIVGSSATKWLLAMIMTGVAATAVYEVRTRRRRQFRSQSIWARDSHSWSSTWFPFLGSSIQE